MNSFPHFLFRFSGLSLLAALSLGILASCQSVHPQVQARNQIIAQEPRGDYFIGRRFFGKASRVWGFVRRPRETWDESRLVVMNEDIKKTPDRFPEMQTPGNPVHGFDHNFEYRIYGNFTGEKGYDPSTNLIFPEFMLRNYELVNRSPGFLFSPTETLVPGRLPRTY